MCRSLMLSTSFALCVVLATVSRADEPGKGHNQPANVKMKAHGEFAGGDEEKTFDLAKEQDRKDLMADLEAGHIHELKKDEPAEIIPKHWDLGLWSLIIFVALLAVLRIFAWKPMLQGLTKREENIRGALEQAEKLRQEAMGLQAQLDAKWKEVGGQIAAAMDEARRERDVLKEQIVSTAKTEIQAERDRLHREMETARDHALKDLYEQSVYLATALSAKAIRRQLSPEDHHRLLDETLAELKMAKPIGKA